jgi:hypothetical protein
MAQASSPRCQYNLQHPPCEDAVKHIGTRCVSHGANIAVIR